MNNLNLQIYRKLLFFSVKEAAQWIVKPKGVSERTWQMWEKGHRKIPQHVEKAIFNLLNYRTTQIEKHYLDVTKEGFITTILWFETIGDWLSTPASKAYLWRPYCSVSGELLSIATNPNLVIFDPIKYFGWLQGEEDSWLERHKWAFSLTTNN